MASRSRDVENREGPDCDTSACAGVFDIKGDEIGSSISTPISPLTRSNISVVFDFLPNCIPLPLGALALQVH